MTIDGTERPYIGVGVLVWKGNRLLLVKELTRVQKTVGNFPVDISSAAKRCHNARTEN